MVKMSSLLSLDHSVTNWLYVGDSVSGISKDLLSLAASWFVYLLPLVLLYLVLLGSYRDRVNSFKVGFIVMFCWIALARLIGDLLYAHYGFRDRPILNINFHELLFNRPEKSFPSDHAAAMLAAGLAFLYYKYPKLGWLFIIGGIISSIARVMAGFHWAGDIIGGWLVALIGFGLVIMADQSLTGVIDWFFVLFSRKRHVK